MLVIKETTSNLQMFQAMMLANLLSAQQIILEMKSTKRWDAITELASLLVQHGKIEKKDKQNVLEALQQREETMSTGIGYGIAIPHASSECISSVVAGFGRSSKGISFDALDNAPVYFIVLFIVPSSQFQIHLRTLAAIAKFLNDKTVRDGLAKAKDVQQILGVFTSRM